MHPTPATPAAQATIRRILETAVEAFAEKGFAGARMDEIAKRAKVNKATIYYHIGNKAALYSAVLHETLGQRADLFIETVGRGRTPEEKLRRYVRCIVENIMRYPSLPRIFMREAASLGAHLPPQTATDLGRIIGVLTQTLAEGRRAGVFVAATPVLIHFMIVGALGYYAQMESVIQRFVREAAVDHPPAASFEASAKEIEDLVVNTVRAVPVTAIARPIPAEKGDRS
ncbi:MAG: TetR/AcrR family transcriptional regulator [Desulfosarcinaceae bacterium]|nr:TetR/AcrR family transcriptional regulator [Desulfosarcinaceae bacterium]